MRKSKPQPAVLFDTAVMIVGLTGIGRQIALQLASLGIRKLILVDAGYMTATDAARAGYAADDIGQPRIHATAAACHAIAPLLNVEAHSYQKLAVLPVVDAVFACMGSQQQRRRLWITCYQRVRFFGVAQATQTRVYIAAITDPKLNARSSDEYELRPPWVNPGQHAHYACPLHVASLAAGLLVCDFAKFIAGETVRREIHVNLRDPALIITGLA